MNIPYVYIIRHKKTGKKYLGSKRGKNSDPRYFMTEYGYTTSSKIVNKIIEKEGIDSFDVELVITEDELRCIPFNNYKDVYEFETELLRYLDCASDNTWFNSHNNPWYYNEKLLPYSVTNYEDWLYRYNEFLSEKGVTSIYHLCDKEKHRKIMNDPKLLERIKNTNIEKYGGHPMQNQKILQKAKNTLLEKYGVDNYSKTNEFKSSMSGANNPMHNIDVYRRHSESVKKAAHKISKTLKNKPIVKCPHCGKEGKDTGAMYQWHFDNCKSVGGQGLKRVKRGSSIKKQKIFDF